MTGDELDEGDASAIALEERFDALSVDVTDCGRRRSTAGPQFHAPKLMIE